ncbi:MAG: hypothetical protein ABI120_04520 [Gemmatimonadaceae bacterium]
MAHTAHSDSDSPNDDLVRVGEQLKQRLEALGVLVHAHDTADELGIMTESVELFETAVESQGGDLMVDEPPAGHRAQPDNAAFVLPTRTANETAHAFVSRIDAATAQLRAKG